jgi:hypothetical protein
MSSNDALAEMSGRVLSPDVSKNVRPLESYGVSAPALRHKGLNIHRKGIPPTPHSQPRASSRRLRVAVDVDEGKFQVSSRC